MHRLYDRMHQLAQVWFGATVDWRRRMPSRLVATVFVSSFLIGCTWTIDAPTTVPPVEPLVPTPIGGTVESTAQDTTPPTHASPTEISESSAAPPLAEPHSLRWRMGVGIPDGQSPLIYNWTSPRPGWYLNWSVGIAPTEPLTDTKTSAIQFIVPMDADTGMEFTPMVHTVEGELQPSEQLIAEVASARPGMTWLIGNEPDVRWQDNNTPEEYAEAYHAAYSTIMQADSTAQVAIGGLSQITPLRLDWLDRAWTHYAEQYGEEMPVDVWNMHAFVLQEMRNDWGVDMPPGFDDVAEGELWGIDDHDDLSIVENQVRRMREWMVQHGQEDKPLWITEYGILMPASYGFDEERVRTFLLASNDLFANLRDPDLGLATDDDRLVQRWLWFSTGYDLYPTGDLFTRNGQPTGLMHTLSAYMEEFK